MTSPAQRSAQPGPDAIHLGPQVARRLPAIVRVLRKAAADHVVQGHRQPRLDVGERAEAATP